MSESARELQAVAADAFGWRALRPDQLEAMEHLLAGRDVLAVLPTGAGKSAIYQVPALLIAGPTVVVSPLLSLQRDQLDRIDRANAPEALAVNSLQSPSERRAAWQALRAGTAEYVFLSPEQLAKEEVVDRLLDAGVGLFVVDEAHCVSAWGHDFRPEYLRLRHVIERLGHPPVVATTATASLPVRRDIIERLGLRNHVEVVASFDRPNLRLAVEHHSDERAKREAVLHRVDALLSAPTARLGLVYTASRKDAESYAADLRKAGRRADHYHAGRRRADRERVHEDFQQNRLDIVVATSAFGMGIDKADVRFVVHVSAPESLDSYYQQIGRAGRDGEGSEVVLFYRPEDLHLQRFLTSHRAPTTALAKIANVLAETEQPMTTAELAELVEVPTVQRVRAVNLLEQAGAVTADAEGRLVYVDRDRTPTDAVAEAVRVAEAHQQLIRSRIEMMRGYAETTGCRRQFLLGYFGESLPEPCGNCDTCAAAADRPEPEPVRDEGAIAESPDSDVAFSVDDPVRHRAWGTGVVMSVEDDRMTVLFDEVGYKTLDLAALTKHKLLTLDEP